MALIVASKSKRFALLAEPLVDRAPDLATLIAYADSAGLALCGYEAPKKEEIASFSGAPLLLLLRQGHGLHMVLCASRQGERFVLLDPVVGKRTVRLDELLPLWTGRFLAVEGYDGAKGESATFWCRPKRGGGVLLPDVLAILTVASATFGVLSLDAPLPFAVGMGSMLLSLVLSLAGKGFMLAAMGRFDDVYMDGVDEEDLTRRRESFVHYHAYKRAVFLSGSDVLGRALSLGAALIFLCFRDIYLAGCCGCAVLLCLAGRLCFHNALRRFSLEAIAKESTYLSAQERPEERRKLRADLRKAGERYGMALWGWNAALVSFCLTLAIVFCLFQGKMGGQMFLFYLLGTLVLTFEADKLLQSPDALNERKREEPYFLLHVASKVGSHKV